MTTRIDRTMSKISGAKNYMDQLAQITGQINSIDEEFYTTQISKIKSIYKQCIIKSLTDAKLNDLINELETNYTSLDLDSLYCEKVKKNKKNPDKPKIRHVVRIRPKDIFESKWFTLMREVESNALNMCKQFELENNSMDEKTMKIIHENPDTVESFKFYGHKITDENIGSCCFICFKFINKIIEIVLSPMYDVKRHMNENWLDQIDSIVGAKMKEEMKTNESITRAEIQEYIYTFLLAKYRLEITGKPEQFTKVMLKSISQYDIANTNPARLLNIIDSLKLEEIGNNKGLQHVTDMAKKEIQKIVNNEEVTPKDILQDIDELLSYGDQPDEEEKPESGLKNELFDTETTQ